MSVESILVVIGGAALLIGILGSIKGQHFEIISIPAVLRIILVLIGGILVAIAIFLSKPELFQSASPTQSQIPQPTQQPSTAQSSQPSPQPTLSIDTIDGTWSGLASARSDLVLSVKITIDKPCDIGTTCGTLELSSASSEVTFCKIDLKLMNVTSEKFVFSKGGSQACANSGTDSLQPLSNQRLLWIPTEGSTSAILERISK